MRYQNTSHAYTLRRTTVKSRSGISLSEWVEQLRKPKNRRSTARLGKPKPTPPNLQASVLAPTQSLVRTYGNVVLNVLFLALVGCALIWFFTDDRFYVQQINIVGNQRVSDEAILSASNLQGYSVFWINAQKVAANIAQALPPINRVHIQSRLPNVVNVTVEEQGEHVMWQVGEKRYWVDDKGLLHAAPEGATPSILVRDIRPGLPDHVDPAAVTAAQQLVMLLPDVPIVEYGPITGLRLQHPKGWQVYLGTGDDMAYKMNVLRAIESQFSGQEAAQPSLIDLRFPDSPYYRLPSAAQGGN